MKILTLISILLLTLQFCRADEELWKGNRLTADQPFPAKVIGVSHTWVGYEDSDRVWVAALCRDDISDAAQLAAVEFAPEA